MSSGIDLRKRVKRQDPPGHKKRKASSPLDAIEAGTPGEVKLSGEAMRALHLCTCRLFFYRLRRHAVLEHPLTHLVLVIGSRGDG